MLDDDQPAIRPLGGASRWWLHGSLDALRTALEALGSRLILRRGAADAVLDELESAPWRPAAPRPAWKPVSQRAPLRRPLQQATGVRVSRRVVSGTRPLVFS